MAVKMGYSGALYSQKRSCMNYANAATVITISDPSGGELDFALADDFSVECWFSTGGDKELVRKRTAAGAGYLLEVSSGKLVFTIEDTSTNETSITGGTSVDDDTWYHAVAVRDAATNDRLYLYLDGASDATAVTDTSTATLATASGLLIGEATAQDAYIGLARVYGAAVSAGEAASIAGGSIVSTLRRKLKGSWPLIEGTGSTAYDDSDYGNDGTITTAAWSTLTYDSVASPETPTGTINGTNTTFTLANDNVDLAGLVVISDSVTLATDGYSITPKGTLELVTAPSTTLTVDYRYYKMTLEAGGFQNWTVSTVADELDVSDFASGEWTEYRTGKRRWTASCENYWLNQGYAYDIDKRLIFVFYHDEANNKSLEGWGYIVSVGNTVVPSEITSGTLTLRGDDLVSVETS